jgi:CHAT domain-containing protein/tetratricopeptide (TPR) repeat protein
MGIVRKIFPVFVISFVVCSLSGRDDAGQAQASRNLSKAQLQGALRTGEFERAKSLVADHIAEADELFLSFLQQDFDGQRSAPNGPAPLEYARRLAEVFFKLFDFDFEKGVISYWEKAGVEQKRALLPILRDHFVLYRDERALDDAALSPVGVGSRFVSRYLSLAERYRAISCGKGELQCWLRASAFDAGKAWKAWQLAKTLKDEVGEAWGAYYYSIWAGEGPSETAARLAVEGGERLRLPRLYNEALTRQAWRALSRDDFEAHVDFFRKGLEVMRTIPVRESLFGHWSRRYYPGEAWFYLAIWRALESKKKTEARDMFEKGRQMSRQYGGKVGELAYLVEATPQLYRPGVFNDIASEAEKLARALGDPGWLAWFLISKADSLIGTQEFGSAIKVATEAGDLCSKLGARDWFAACLSKRAVSRAQSNDYPAAVADFKQAIRIYNELELPENAANAGLDAGYYLRSQPSTAMDFLNDALAAAEKTGDPGLISGVLNRRAQTRQSDAPSESVQDYMRALMYSERVSEEANTPGDYLGMMSRVSQALIRVGNFNQAIEIQNQRAEKARAKDLARIEADAYYWLQNIYSQYLGEPAKAAECVKKWQALLDRPGWKPSVNDLNKLAQASANLGQPARALEFWAKALKLAKETPAGEHFQRMVHNNVAELYLKLGDYDAVLAELEEVKNLIDRTFDAYRMSIELQRADLSNMTALAYVLAGDLAKAVELSVQAVDLEMKAAPGTALANYYPYFTPGDALALAGRYDESLDFYAKRRERAKQSKSITGERAALLGLGTVALRAGDTPKARDAFQGAVEIDRKPPGPQTGSLAQSLLKLAQLELSSGNPTRANALLAEARKTANPYDPNQLWQIERSSAHVYAKTGKSDLARQHFEQALNSLEDARERYRPEEFELRFGIDRLKVYDEYASYLVELAANTSFEADAAKALLVLERRRGQALWDLMATGWAGLQPEAVPEQLQRVREIEAQLTAKQNALRGQFNLAPDKRNARLIESLEAGLRKAKDEHAQLLTSLSQGRFRFSSPAGMRLDNLAGLQKYLGRNQALVEYLVDDETTFGFVLTSTGLKSERLAIGRETLRRKVRQLLEPFYRLRTGELDLARLGFDLEISVELYKSLFAPLEPHLGRATQILIVPDDVLRYLPFEVLVDRLPQKAPSSRIVFAEFGQAGFLLRRFTMSYLTAASHLPPSAANLQTARTDLTLLAMADPAARQGSPSSGSEDPLKRQLRSSSFRAAFSPLPGAMSEVEAISGYFPQKSVARFSGGQATETIYKTMAAKYGIVHLATHAVASDDQPLYSTLILAPDDKDREDGFLQAYEILRHPLRARLVVLSACETALGPLGRGEGLVGLVSAFQQAGAGAVIATQWSIDESAANVMAVFYEGLTSGKDPSAALRDAKLDILKKRMRYGGTEISLAHPFFWAPFVFIGR